MKYISINRIITKIKRDIRDDTFNELDIIEWIGEALDYLKVPGFMEEAIAFQEVKNYTTPLPEHFVYPQQIMKLDMNYSKEDCYKEIIDEVPDDSCVWTCDYNDGIPLDCEGRPLIEVDVAYYLPSLTINLAFQSFTKSKAYNKFKPIRKASSTFFYKEMHENDLYSNCYDEYKIRSNDILFNFEEGYVAISFYKLAIECKTGLPLIPDDVHTINAISYYVKWKMSEYYAWSGKRGFMTISQDMERKWIKYIQQAKSHFYKPKTIDDLQNLMSSSLRLIPTTLSYYNFFKNLNKDVR